MSVDATHGSHLHEKTTGDGHGQWQRSLRCFSHGCDGRSFSSYSNYRRHMKEKATSRLPFICPQCKRKFSRSTARNIHFEKGRCKEIAFDENGVPFCTRRADLVESAGAASDSQSETGASRLQIQDLGDDSSVDLVGQNSGPFAHFYTELDCMLGVTFGASAGGGSSNHQALLFPNTDTYPSG